MPPAADAAARSYPPEQVRAGQPLFSAHCGFCHGRDAMGGETGPDLTRAASVAADVRGNTIGPLVRNGRVDKGMPSFSLGDADIAAIVAFIHDQTSNAASLTGGRRAVEVADLQTGNAEAGKRYFGDRLLEMPLARPATLPASRPDWKGSRSSSGCCIRPAPRPRRTPRSPSHRRPARSSLVRSPIATSSRSRSPISPGAYRAFPADRVKFIVDDPLQAHVEQLGKYTDADMHNVLAYLQTLR